MQETPHVIALFGDSTKHSISPTIHNATFARHELPFVYIPVSINLQQLPYVRELMTIMDIEGANVTFPHKQNIMKFCDKIDATAERIGAVNTLVYSRKKLIGYNTDAYGISQAIKEKFGINLRKKKILLIGAGGAALACADVAVNSGAKELIILNRSKQPLTKMQSRLRKYSKATAVKVDQLNLQNIRKYSSDSDLVLQATSAPLSGKNSLAWPKRCKGNAVIMDLRYGLNNKFLEGAIAAGYTVCDGIPMLIWQAAHSFELWTKTSPNLEIMRKAAQTAVLSKGKK